MVPERTQSRFDLRDLVLVALLSAVGGVLSTYVGYLGNLINRLFGVPFGAGQLIAGVHVLWPLLARAVLGKFGSGIFTGVLKGLVEFFSGGTHGIVIVIVSAIEGLFVDVGMSMAPRRSVGVMMVSGAVASASNVLVFQALYLSGIPWSFILGMAALALVSGAFFGGYLAWDLHGILSASRLVRSNLPAARARRPIAWRRHLLTLAVVLVGLAGAAYYYMAVFDPFSSPNQARIEGSVRFPYTFRVDTWDGEWVTVTAELRGASTTVPARPYTGALVHAVAARAVPDTDVQSLRVIASDGYEVRFDWPAVQADAQLLLVLEEEELRIVAAAYDGAYWVRKVRRLVLE